MARKLSKTAQINAYITSNPTAPSSEVAKKFGVKSGYVSSLKWALKKKGVDIPATGKSKFFTTVMTSNASILKHIAPDIPVYEDSVEFVTPGRLINLTRHKDGTMTEEITMIEPPADPVNHPAHYKAGGIETIDFIEAKKLGYNLGNVVKYITRADLKGNRKQDLEKALWYLKREIGAQ